MPAVPIGPVHLHTDFKTMQDHWREATRLDLRVVLGVATLVRSTEGTAADDLDRPGELSLRGKRSPFNSLSEKKTGAEPPR